MATAVVTRAYDDATLQATITYTVTNAATTHTVNATKVVYKMLGANITVPISASISYGGTTLDSRTFTNMPFVKGSSRAVTISKSVSTTKTHSTQAGTFSFSGGTHATISIPAKTSYTVSYDANGGSGAPGSQTKWHGETLTLSSTKPTRTSYSFYHWNTGSANGGTTYASGGSYTGNAALKLYAIWNPIIYYNANGGSGAPSSQTKTYGTNLKLSTTVPTRTGYTFKNWNTKADGSGTSYAGGSSPGTYTGNTTVTFYAQWTINTYTVTYYANGGTGVPSKQTKTYNVPLTLSSTKPSRSGYTFAGWNTSSSASSVSYSPGAVYSSNAALSLYAIWKPNISGTLTLTNRCSDAACTVEDEDGTYLKATVTWSCAVSVSSSSLSVKSDSGLTIGSYTFTAGTTGTYSAVISGFQADKSYQITATFGTSAGSGLVATSASVSKTASGAVYMLDFKGKTNVGILGAASDDPYRGLSVHTPQIELVNPSNDSVDTFLRTINQRTGTECGFGVGSGGVNHGVYSTTMNKWLIYGNGSTVYVNNIEIADSGWQNLPIATGWKAYSSGRTPKYRKKNGMVELLGAVSPTSALTINETEQVFGNLPAGYRPIYEFQVMQQGSGRGVWYASVHPDGRVAAVRYRDTNSSSYKSASTSEWFTFHLTFFAD